MRLLKTKRVPIFRQNGWFEVSILSKKLKINCSCTTCTDFNDSLLQHALDGLSTAPSPPDVQITMFADDAAIWVHDKCLIKASSKIKAALDNIAAWSRSKLMEINTSKSEATFFSNDSISKEAGQVAPRSRTDTERWSSPVQCWPKVPA